LWTTIKLLNMLRRTLSYEGFQVLTATNGHEALAEVQAHRPDVIVLDWFMPGLDGPGVLERLRRAGDKTLVLMLTARLRLTLLYSAILALTLIAFSTVLYATQSHATFGGIRSNLVRQASFLAGTREAPGPGGQPTGPGSPPPVDALTAALTSGSLPGRWTQVRSVDGAVKAQTNDLSGTSRPLSDKGLRTVQGGQAWFESAQVQSEPLLIYSQRVTTQGGVPVIVQVAFPIAQPQQSLKTLRVILMIGSSLVFLAAFVIGWVLAGTALRPIHRITRTAQAIGAEHDFSRRVEHQGPADEVGQLAVTFNEMLAALESGYR
jgi:two-component system OmpR family sensor kinase